LKKFILGQYEFELLQYYISRRTMTAESMRWRRWPPGGIGVEKFYLEQYVIELLQYCISRKTMTVESIRWRRWPKVA